MKLVCVSPYTRNTYSLGEWNSATDFVNEKWRWSLKATAFIQLPPTEAYPGFRFSPFRGGQDKSENEDILTQKICFKRKVEEQKSLSRLKTLANWNDCQWLPNWEPRKVLQVDRNGRHSLRTEYILQFGPPPAECADDHPQQLEESSAIWNE